MSMLRFFIWCIVLFLTWVSLLMRITELIPAVIRTKSHLLESKLIRTENHLASLWETFLIKIMASNWSYKHLKCCCCCCCCCCFFFFLFLFFCFFFVLFLFFMISPYLQNQQILCSFDLNSNIVVFSWESMIMWESNVIFLQVGTKVRCS